MAHHQERGQCARRLRLYRHGELRHHGAAARLRPAGRARTAAMLSPRCGRHGVTPGLAALVLGLGVVGAGSKAGLVPLHVWLPLAHPAAPSHVSALMSGVMTKVAVYGFVRIVFDLLGRRRPGGGALWSWRSAAATAVIGVLLRADAKRSQARCSPTARSRISASSSSVSASRSPSRPMASPPPPRWR